MRYDYWLDNTGLSNGKKKSLIDNFQSAKEVYHLPLKAYDEQNNWTKADTEKIEASKKNWDIDREWEKLYASKTGFLTLYSENYPQRLKKIYDSPFGIYYQGKLPGEELSAAIVGARRCSEYGYYMAKKLGEALGRNGIAVISGMAEGIDAAGHIGALEGGGTSYAVFGCGTDICYPKKNKRLYENLQKKGGIISELRPKTQPRPYFFPARNRIISGLADIVIVIEAKKKSGSLITADYALEQGKEIYALPGRVTDALSYGCNNLISQGAGMILSVEDFLKELNLTENQKEKIDKKQKLRLAKEESLVYSCLSIQAKSMDQIVEETSLEISKAAEALLHLQSLGIVKESFRNYYIEDEE